MNYNIQVIDMEKDSITPPEGVTVKSSKQVVIKPDVLRVFDDPNKYVKSDVITYSEISDMIATREDADIVAFTYRWPDGHSLAIVRTFFGEDVGSPAAESVINLGSNDEPLSGRVFIRKDIFDEFNNSQPNVFCSEGFMYELFEKQDTGWDDVIKACNGEFKLEDILHSKEPNALEHFVLDGRNAKEVKMICEKYGLGEPGMDLKRAATLAIEHALVSLADAITVGIFGEEAYNCVCRKNILDAEIHLSSLGLIGHSDESGYVSENVYVATAGLDFLIVAGALDENDATNDFITKFNTDLEISDIMTVKLTYLK